MPAREAVRVIDRPLIRSDPHTGDNTDIFTYFPLINCDLQGRFSPRHATTVLVCHWLDVEVTNMNKMPYISVTDAYTRSMDPIRHFSTDAKSAWRLFSNHPVAQTAPARPARGDTGWIQRMCKVLTRTSQQAHRQTASCSTAVGPDVEKLSAVREPQNSTIARDSFVTIIEPACTDVNHRPCHRSRRSVRIADIW